MDPLEEILGLLRLAKPTQEQDARLEELYAGLDDSRLAAFETALLGLFDEIHAGEITPEVITHLTRIADVVDGVRYMAGERITAAESVAAEQAAAEAERTKALTDLASRVHTAPVESAPVATAPAPTESATPAQETVTAPTSVVQEAEAITEQAAEPVTAAAVATRAEIAQNTRAQTVARPEPAQAKIRLAGNGTELPNLVAVEDALLERWSDLDGTQSPGRHRVASFHADVPAERRLPEGKITDVRDIQAEMQAKLTEPGGAESLTADGGICGPVEFYYGVQTLGQAGRPLRASIGSFNATRGGIAFNSPMTINNILSATTPAAGNAIGVVTEAQDAAGNTDKSVQRINCGTSTEVRVDAVYLQLEFGVFQDRTNPERKAQFTELSQTAYARFSEQRLWAKMMALTTEVNAPQELGATRDFLTALNRFAINYRHRHRMPETASLDMWAPSWVGMGLLPDDQTNALQSYPQQFEVTAAKVEAWLALKNIRVANWYQDDFTDALSAGGGVAAYPASFKVIVAHPGAFTLVDNGRLDLGVVRDSTLIVSNLFRTFMEEFWNVAMWGVEADSIEFALCANGASAGSIAPTCGS